MKPLIAIVLILFSTIAHGQSNNIPKSWWRAQVSVQKVESDDRAWRNGLIGDLKKSKLIDSHGNPLDQQSIERTIKQIQDGSILRQRDWIRLKSRILPGDQLRQFSAPPMSGPVGYVLIRDGGVIDSIAIADQ